MSYLSNNQKIFYSTSKSITINFHLKLLLKKISNYRAIGVDRQRSFILGWGRKRSGKNAVSIAAHQDKRFLLLEDGFLRSVRRLDCSLSFVFDEVGIYYDATVPSRLEELILQVLSEDQLIRTQKIICSWRKLRLSKYNSLPEYSQPLPDKYVLVVDQVAGDLSIKYGMANHDSFERMLQAAINDNIESTILVKVHPDLLTCQKSGHFNYFKLKTISRVRIISEPCHCVKLIERAQKVYVVTSQVGFEALLWGKQVHCFGMPFYAGWGLTQDELSTPLRRRRVGLTQLANAALVKYPRYVDLESKAECSLESAMHHVALQRQNRLRFNSKLYALQFSRWKKKYLKLFFAGSEIVFIKTMSQLPKGGHLNCLGK